MLWSFIYSQGLADQQPRSWWPGGIGVYRAPNPLQSSIGALSLRAFWCILVHLWCIVASKRCMLVVIDDDVGNVEHGKVKSREGQGR